jgi:hypothetical protein
MRPTQRRQVAAETFPRDPLEHEPKVVGQLGAEGFGNGKVGHRAARLSDRISTSIARLASPTVNAQSVAGDEPDWASTRLQSET